jgi:hypothetical protein
MSQYAVSVQGRTSSELSLTRIPFVKIFLRFVEVFTVRTIGNSEPFRVEYCHTFRSRLPENPEEPI